MLSGLVIQNHALWSRQSSAAVLPPWSRARTGRPDSTLTLRGINGFFKTVKRTLETNLITACRFHLSQVAGADFKSPINAINLVLLILSEGVVWFGRGKRATHKQAARDDDRTYKSNQTATSHEFLLPVLATI